MTNKEMWRMACLSKTGNETFQKPMFMKDNTGENGGSCADN